ncbi:MAG: arylesterase [bacterium]|nr:arylesterase [bacterium]
MRPAGFLVVIGCLAVSCGAPPAGSGPTAADPAPAAGTPADSQRSAPRPAAEEDDRPLVVFLGDSLTAGLGLGEEQAFPARIAESLHAEGTPVRVVNAGVSGDTTAGGLRRLDWLLRQEPDVLVVGLGANDGLRALALEATEDNLRQIISRTRSTGTRVLLAGMQVPPNYGPDYATGFAEIFPRLAEELRVPLIPFLLEGVAAVPELNQADGIHPNVAGQRRVAETVLAPLRLLVAEVAARDRAPAENGSDAR